MIRGFIEGTSRELEEVAVVDGTSWAGAFLRVTVPQIWPGLLSTALFVYICTVNEFLFASIMLPGVIFATLMHATLSPACHLVRSRARLSSRSSPIGHVS